MTLLIDKEGAKFPSALSKRFMEVSVVSYSHGRCVNMSAGVCVSM